MHTQSTFRICPTLSASILGALAVLAVAPILVAAQSVDLGLGLGLFVDYPPPFEEQYCSSAQAAFTGSATLGVFEWLGLEGSAALVGGTGATTCAIPGLIPPPLDTPLNETSYRDGIRGGSYLATHVGVVLEPLRTSAVSPRLRAGAGRLWGGKKLNDAYWGAGIRYRFGRHALVTDVERWRFDVPSLDETVIYRAGGVREVQTSETLLATYEPFVVRIGWQVSVR